MSSIENTSRARAALKALRASGRTSPKATRSISALIDKLAAPVRIGLFGLPGAGKLACASALSGVGLADLGALPTLELSQAEMPQTEALLPDGRRLTHAGLPDAALLAQTPAFLRIRVPEAVLAGRSFLVVASEASQNDVAAALAWAAPRVDIALWCSRDWTRHEAALWHAAPDRLRNHALLVCSSGAILPETQAQAEGFVAACPAPGNAAPSDLAARLTAIIDEAATQDILAARMLLQRHGTDLDEAPPPDIAARPIPRPIPCAARDELARLFQHLRGEADDLWQGLDAVETDDILARCEDLMATLSERAAGLDHLDETWPALPTVLSEARDLALLLRMEGGDARCADAARLVLQVRQEMEILLAA